MPIDYYLALLQLHLAVVGVVIAGVIALVQLLNSAKPRRDIRLLIKPPALAAYVTLLVGLLLVLAVGSWVAAFPEGAPGKMVELFASSALGFYIVAMMLVSLGWFAILSLKARVLLDSQLYLQLYVERMPADCVHEYIEAIYTNTDKPIPPDPFQPIREYIKDNAFKYYDYGTADGLKHFSRLFDKALASSRTRKDNDVEYERLARYMSESCEEFFRIFVHTASEKRKADTINHLYGKGVALLQGSHDASHASMLPIVRALENIAKISDDDDEIIMAIGRIRQLLDIFMEGHKTNDWAHIAGIFDEVCLSLSRATEDYYLQKNNSLKTVPIVGYTTGEHHTVTSALVEFFMAYRNLSDRHIDATPRAYFDAIEGVLEVLFVRLGDIEESGLQHVGFNARYHVLASQLYQIYFEFGMDAVANKKPDLLTMVLSNLRRVIKPAKNFKLKDERQDLCRMIIELSTRGILVFGNIVIKSGGRTIADYAVETIGKHATEAQVASAIANLRKQGIDLSSQEIKQLLKQLSD